MINMDVKKQKSNNFKLFKKLLPYLLILVLGIVIFNYYNENKELKNTKNFTTSEYYKLQQEVVINNYKVMNGKSEIYRSQVKDNTGKLLDNFTLNNNERGIMLDMFKDNVFDIIIIYEIDKNNKVNMKQFNKYNKEIFNICKNKEALVFGVVKDKKTLTFREFYNSMEDYKIEKAKKE